MKLLLDECLPLDFRHCFPNHQAYTAEWAGFKGTKNGELLRLAEVAGYEVILTVDHGIPHQQRPGSREISIILIRAQTNQLEDLMPLAGASNVLSQSSNPARRSRWPLNSLPPVQPFFRQPCFTGRLPDR